MQELFGARLGKQLKQGKQNELKYKEKSRIHVRERQLYSNEKTDTLITVIYDAVYSLITLLCPYSHKITSEILYDRRLLASDSVLPSSFITTKLLFLN